MLQCTWGILQTLAGAVLFLILIKRRHFIYRSDIVTCWNRGESLSLGLFIFVTVQADEKLGAELCAHEYGHSIQSIILGPLYLPVIALPSSVWCMAPGYVRKRQRSGISYYSFYTEKWANSIAEKITGRKPELLE